LRASNLLKWLALAAAIAVVAFFGRGVAFRLPEFAAWVESLGVWGPAAFIVGYGVAAVVLAPAFLLTIAAGAIWGLRSGVLYVMVGATLGAVLAFTASRYLVRRFVEHYVLAHPRLAAIDRAVEAEGARLVFLLRLSPVVSYVLLNYVLGISRVRFRDYFAGSIGMLPTVTAYVYAGRVAGDLASVAGGAALPRGPLWLTTVILGLAATVVATVLVARASKRAVDEAVRAQLSVDGHDDLP
jgi:uncharacterized membrane protein YdjX (TVP38/TMEM64 family)